MTMHPAWDGNKIRLDDSVRCVVNADLLHTRDGSWYWGAVVTTHGSDGAVATRRGTGKRRTESDARAECERWIQLAWQVALGLEHETELQAYAASIMASEG